VKYLFFFLGFSLIATADLASLDKLDHQQWAREASNRKFLAEVELGNARLEMARAQYVHDTNVGLLAKHAIEKFTVSNSHLKLLEADFNARRAEFHVGESSSLESMWKLRLLALSENREVTKEIAKINIELCERRIKLFEYLDKALVKYSEEINFQYTRSKDLYEHKALSADAFNQMHLVKTGTDELVKAVKEELVIAAKQKAEAEKL